MREKSILLLGVWLSVATVLPCSAQDRAMTTNYVGAVAAGLMFGAELLPVELDPGCPVEGDKYQPGINAGLRIRFPVAGFGVEARATRHWRNAEDCPDILAPLPDGIHTSRDTELDSGGFSATDLRVIVDFGVERRYFVAFGPGWAWTKNVPFATSSVGKRFGGKLRWRVAADFEIYRVPMEVLTADYRSGKIVDVLGASRTHRLVNRFGVHIDYQIPFVM